MKNLYTDPGISREGGGAQDVGHQEARNEQEQKPRIPKALDENQARAVLRLSEILRPLWLLPIGKEAAWIKAYVDFIEHARLHDLPISYVENPKSKGPASRLRYHRYVRAGALREAL